MSPTIRLLGPGDASLLDRVAPDVFDNPIDPRRTAEFLADGRHHLAVAFDGDVVVGMSSAVHHLHPDKPPELWINEVGVAPPYRGQGVGRRLLQALFERGREPGCRLARVGTERSRHAGPTPLRGGGRCRSVRRLRHGRVPADAGGVNARAAAHPGNTGLHPGGTFQATRGRDHHPDRPSTGGPRRGCPPPRHDTGFRSCCARRGVLGSPRGRQSQRG